MLDFEFSTDQVPEKGKLLISEPFIDDDYFKRSVVLLCEHNETGSFGFVLNHYIDVNMTEMVPDFPDFDVRVSIGGPVSTSNVFYLHDIGEEIDGSIAVRENIFMGGDFEMIKAKLISGEATPENVRFFVGYSGWSANQLEEEMKEKAWIVSNTSYKEIMDTMIDKLWVKTLARQGKKFQIMSDFPSNFRLN